MAHQTPGYEQITARTVQRWSVPKVAKKMGRPVNEAFELTVLDQLVYTTVAETDSANEVDVVANVAYSYPTIRIAAVNVQHSAPFADDEKIQAMKFADTWVKGWLDRVAFLRRRITAFEKVLPPVSEVQAQMESLQATMIEEDYEDDEVISTDETGCNFGAGPKDQYVPLTAVRAYAPDLLQR